MNKKAESQLSRCNAMGLGAQDIDDELGGNNDRSFLNNVYPTGIMATGSATMIGDKQERVMPPAWGKSGNKIGKLRGR